jgi:predicted TPR repeat methyltransferase
MDLGCGTGMSTIALKEIAERIIGGVRQLFWRLKGE